MRKLLMCFVVGLSADLAIAQVVQLPTFQQFSVNTTVSVPDRGAALLGGVNTSRSGSTTRSIPMLGRVPVANRLFQNRSFGRDSSSSQAHVRVTIIDHQELDEALLGQAAATRARRMQPLVIDPIEAQARFITQHVGRTSRNAHVAADVERAAVEQLAMTKKSRTTSKAVRTAKPAEPPLILKRK